MFVTNNNSLCTAARSTATEYAAWHFPNGDLFSERCFVLPFLDLVSPDLRLTSSLPPVPAPLRRECAITPVYGRLTCAPKFEV